MTRDEVMRADQSSGGMFAVIPSVVMRDPALSMSARMLYGIITWRCNDKAYCWASNRALGETIGLSAKRVSALVSDLEAQGHIETEIIKDPETGAVKFRRIYPIVKSGRGLADPIPKNEDTPPPEAEDTSPQFRGDPPPENEEEKYKDEIKKEKPPKAPQGGRAAKGKRDPRIPQYRPDLFERFWSKYPLREGRRSPRSDAVRAWDKLKPSMELCFAMSAALEPWNWPESWHRDDGRYIPLASTWINRIAKDGAEYLTPPKRPAQGEKPAPPPPRASHVKIINGEEVVIYDDPGT